MLCHKRGGADSACAQIAIWDWERVHERSVYKPHGALTNNIRFLPGRNGTAAVSCGTDGKLKVRAWHTQSSRWLVMAA